MTDLQKKYPHLTFPGDIEQPIVMRAPHLAVSIHGFDHMAWGIGDIALFKSTGDASKDSQIRDISFPVESADKLQPLPADAAYGILLPGALVQIMEVREQLLWPTTTKDVIHDKGPILAYLDRKSSYLHSFLEQKTRRNLHAVLGITIEG